MEPDPTDTAEVDAHHERETAWRVSLLLGSVVAAIVAAAVAVGPVLPPSGVLPGVLGHAADASALFLMCSVFVGAALLAQWPIDDRLRRLPLPLWLFAVTRGASLALVAGVVVTVITSVAGLWPSPPRVFGSGAIAGAWIGAFGALVGTLLERSRVSRIIAITVILLAVGAGAVALVVLRSLA